MGAGHGQSIAPSRQNCKHGGRADGGRSKSGSSPATDAAGTGTFGWTRARSKGHCSSRGRRNERKKCASVNQGRLMTTLGLRITGLHSAVPQWERGAVRTVTLYRQNCKSGGRAEPASMPMQLREKRQPGAGHQSQKSTGLRTGGGVRSGESGEFVPPKAFASH